MSGLGISGALVLAMVLAVLAGCGGGSGGGANAGSTELFAAPIVTALGANAPPLRVVDVNSDGKVDIAVAGRTPLGTWDDLPIFLGNGDDTFRASGTIAAAARGAIADVDGDGKPDLAYCAGANTVAIRLGNGDGTFRDPVYFVSGPASSACRLVSVGDVDGDGHLDVVVANADPPDPQPASDARFVYVMRGNGDGMFSSPVLAFDNGRWISSMSMSDLNKDGSADLIVNWVSLDAFSAGADARLGRADGSFGTRIDLSATVPDVVGVPGGTIATCCADFNGDGVPDITLSEIVLHLTDRGSPKRSYVLLGNGDGTFRNAGQLLDKTVIVSTWADFDGDGRTDLIVAQGDTIDSATSKLLLYGNGNGTFATPVPLPVFEGTVYAAADVDRDGHPDLVALRLAPTGDAADLLVLSNRIEPRPSPP